MVGYKCKLLLNIYIGTVTPYQQILPGTEKQRTIFSSMTQIICILFVPSFFFFFFIQESYAELNKPYPYETICLAVHPTQDYLEIPITDVKITYPQHYSPYPQIMCIPSKYDVSIRQYCCKTLEGYKYCKVTDEEARTEFSKFLKENNISIGVLLPLKKNK